MSLSNRQKKHYRTLGHSLKPVVIIAGKGLTTAVANEVDRALNGHELIKVKLAITDRNLRQQVTEQLCHQTGAAVIQSIGKVILIFRAAATPSSRLSNLLR